MEDSGVTVSLGHGEHFLPLWWGLPIDVSEGRWLYPSHRGGGAVSLKWVRAEAGRRLENHGNGPLLPGIPYKNLPSSFYHFLCALTGVRWTQSLLSSRSGSRKAHYLRAHFESSREPQSASGGCSLLDPRVYTLLQILFLEQCDHTF